MGLFDSIGNIISTSMANRANRENVQSQNDVNAQLARERNDLEVKLWREQAEYNSPKAQMSRLQEAGLNPMLAYGSLADAKMGPAPDMVVPRMEAPHAEAARMSGDTNPVAEYTQMKNDMALNAIRRAEVRKVQAEAVSAEARAKYDMYETDMYVGSGAVKSDNSILKGIMRAGDMVYKSGQYWGTKALELNKSVSDSLWNTGRWIMEKATRR